MSALDEIDRRAVEMQFGPFQGLRAVTGREFATVLRLARLAEQVVHHARCGDECAKVREDIVSEIRDTLGPGAPVKGSVMWSGEDGKVAVIEEGKTLTEAINAFKGKPVLDDDRMDALRYAVGGQKDAEIARLNTEGAGLRDMCNERAREIARLRGALERIKGKDGQIYDDRELRNDLWQAKRTAADALAGKPGNRPASGLSPHRPVECMTIEVLPPWYAPTRCDEFALDGHLKVRLHFCERHTGES